MKMLQKQNYICKNVNKSKLQKVNNNYIRKYLKDYKIKMKMKYKENKKKNLKKLKRIDRLKKS